MSSAWAEKHGVALPQDYNAKQETYAVRNANGTGPFVLKTLRAGSAARADRQSELVGQAARHRQRRRSDLHGDSGRMRRGSPRWRRARWTS